MKLRELLQQVSYVEVRGSLDKDIQDIVYDSRKVKDDYLFICIEGMQTDGHKYIDDAVNRGAAAIVIEKELDNYIDNMTYIKVQNSRKAMSYVAEIFFDYPLENLKLIGVTGTNGKTTTTYLIKGILEAAGKNTGLIGTIKNLIGQKEFPTDRTTPESLDLYRLFKRMVISDIEYVVMEVSSHALDLNRVQGMLFEVAVFTNITQDHLDYHKTLARYLEVKSRLFKQISKRGWGVINGDDAHASSIIAATAGQLFTYGIENNTDITADDIKLHPQGVSYILTGDNIKQTDISLNFTGKFNVYNSLAAIGCGLVLGLEETTIKQGLQNIEGVPGRFELINEGQSFAVVVDYAHTPDGMKNVLNTAAEFVKGNIIVVFGCGGDRDQGKRPQMGKIGAEYGDDCIITSDNPRSEEPMAIINEIEVGIKEAESMVPYQIIPDRRQAISEAITRAEADDMVIIFGKGHETYQIFKDKTIHFDDREVAREVLRLLVEGDVDVTSVDK